MGYVSALRGSGHRVAPQLDRGMAHDGKTQREAAKRTLGLAALGGAPVATPPDANGAAKPPELPPIAPKALSAPPDRAVEPDGPRRTAKRRPAGPARSRLAANDDAP